MRTVRNSVAISIPNGVCHGNGTGNCRHCPTKRQGGTGGKRRVHAQLRCGTANDEFVAKLTEQIKKDYEIDTVYVSRSPKVMQIVDRLSKLDEASRQEIVRRLIEAERLRTDTATSLLLPTVSSLFE